MNITVRCAPTVMSYADHFDDTPKTQENMQMNRKRTPNINNTKEVVGILKT